MEVLTSGIFVWIKLLLLGWAWCWILPDRLLSDANRIKQWMHAGAAVSLLGVLLTSLSTLFLGELGWFSRAGEGLVRVALFSGGVAGGWLAGRKRFVALLTRSAPVSLTLLAGFILIMLYPHRGEWIIGGLDPGVYMNEAAALSRTGTFYPPDRLFYDEFSTEQQRSLIRSGFGRTERFPAVLVYPEKKSFSFEFFRLTPSLFAAIHRSGDMLAMTRSNTFIALMALVCFAALLLKHFATSHAIFAVLLLIAQPVFLYHCHIPITEMTQLLLLISFLFLIVDQPFHGWSVLMAGLCLFAATLNRFAFLPFGGILMICLAFSEHADPDRRHVIHRRIFFISLCMAAGFINYHIAPASLRGWSDIYLILIVASMAALFSILLDLLFSIPWLRQLASGVTSWKLDVLAILAVALWIMTWIWHENFGSRNDHDNLFRLIPFTGWLPLSASAAGAIAFFFLRPRIKASVLFPVVIFFLTVAWLLILRKSIMDLYPWATRRYLPYLIPFIALSCGYLLSRCWQWPRFNPAGKVVALVALAALLIEPAESSRRAWLYTQYNGIGHVLQQIAERIDPDDIVVADHANWGTPLALVHGKTTLNGRELWKDASGHRMNTVLPALARLSGEGRRVRFVTSTGKGMELYPVQLQIDEDWSSGEVTYQQMIQHRNADRFELTTHESTFRIYTVIGFPESSLRQ